MARLKVIENIKAHQIACELEFKKGYVYAENEDQVKQLEDLCKGIKDVGLDCEYTDEVATPVPYQLAIMMEHQAQFHQLKYLQGIQRAYLNAGGPILEHTWVDSVKPID